MDALSQACVLNAISLYRHVHLQCDIIGLTFTQERGDLNGCYLGFNKKSDSNKHHWNTTRLIP